MHAVYPSHIIYFAVPEREVRSQGQFLFCYWYTSMSCICILSKRNEILGKHVGQENVCTAFHQTMDQIIKGVVAWVMIKRTVTLVSQGCSPTMPWPGINTQNAGFHDMLCLLQESQGWYTFDERRIRLADLWIIYYDINRREKPCKDQEKKAV